MHTSRSTVLPKKNSAPRTPEAPAFAVRPERMIEWLGGVTYANLERIIGTVKTLMGEKPGEEIGLLVSSYGGATGIGMTFYDSVATWLRPNLVTVGSGDVDSSALIVFLAGKKRFLTPNTTLLLHLAGRTLEQGKRISTADLDAMLTEDRLKDFHYASVVSEATDGEFSPEEILDLMAKNTILTAQDAIDMGLAHGVLQ